ncbi:hypothetical protein HHI36_018534, partial [Cryptolaemus montrouzieri]
SQKLTLQFRLIFSSSISNLPLENKTLFHSKLKGINVVISNDLTHQQRKENGILRKHMKNARTSGKQVYIKGNRLVVENKEYTIEDLEEGEIESGEGNLEEKTSNINDTKEEAGSKGQAEGRQIQY